MVSEERGCTWNDVKLGQLSVVVNGFICSFLPRTRDYTATDGIVYLSTSLNSKLD